jgi:bifunctional non-homologous end joining protein LigD
MRVNRVPSIAPSRPSDPQGSAGTLAVTHPEKILWPADGITKGDLIAYYRAVAHVLVPHVRDRPLVLRPFPNGIAAASYYRQSLPRTAPAWLPRYRHAIRAGGRVNEMLVVTSERELVWLANQAAIEVHPWLSRVDRPDAPDYVVFDLDVLRPELFARALAAALLLRAELDRLGLRGYPKTSGGDGLHVYVPIDRGPSYAATRAWAEAMARRLEAAHPDLVVSDAEIAGRGDRVLVDYAQNSRGRTTVAPYSVRPRPGAPVSAPLTWEEVAAGRVRPTDFTMRTMLPRLAAAGDLFAPVTAGGQSLVDPAAAPAEPGPVDRRSRGGAAGRHEHDEGTGPRRAGRRMRERKALRCV